MAPFVVQLLYMAFLLKQTPTASCDGPRGDSSSSAQAAIAEYMSATADEPLFDLGEYATLTRDHSPRLNALITLDPLLRPLLYRNPSARVRETELKVGFLSASHDGGRTVMRRSREQLAKFVWTQVMLCTGCCYLVRPCRNLSVGGSGG